MLTEVYKHYENAVDKAHGIDHINAVRDTALKIAEGYPEINKEDVVYAAVLHDIGHERAREQGTDDHETIGVQMAKPYIKHLPLGRQYSICDAIRSHRTSNGNPQTMLGKIVYDADKSSPSIVDSLRRPYDYRLARGMSNAEALVSAYHYVCNDLVVRLDKQHMYTEEARKINKGFTGKMIASVPTLLHYKSMIGA